MTLEPPLEPTPNTWWWVFVPRQSEGKLGFGCVPALITGIGRRGHLQVRFVDDREASIPADDWACPMTAEEIARTQRAQLEKEHVL